MKIGRYNRNRRAEEAAIAEPDADALRQENLPVLAAGRRCHCAAYYKHAAREKEGAKETCVREASGDRADKKEQEDLDRADPRYTRW